MLPGRMTLQLVAFAMLSVGVAANVFFLQSREQRSEVAESAPWSMASAETVEVGDTGSIERASEARAAAKAKIISVSGGLGHPPVAEAASPTEVTRAVQRELQIRGYETGARDGVAGLMTRGAILAFEYDHGLPAQCAAEPGASEIDTSRRWTQPIGKADGGNRERTSAGGHPLRAAIAGAARLPARSCQRQADGRHGARHPRLRDRSDAAGDRARLRAPDLAAGAPVERWQGRRGSMSRPVSRTCVRRPGL